MKDAGIEEKEGGRKRATKKVRGGRGSEKKRKSVKRERKSCDAAK